MSKLDKILNTLSKKYKDIEPEIIGKASDKMAEIDWIPTNIYALDRVMGKGLPRGRMVEIWGKASSGKSTTALQIISAIQRRGGTAAFIDAEQTYDSKWGEACGINNDELIIVKPNNGEQALSIVESMVDTGELDLIVVDSIPSLLPKAIQNKEIGCPTVGEQARMMSVFMQKVTPKLAKTKTTIILINQTRTNIGVMFGDPTTLPGGASVEFYASIILKVARDKKRIVYDPVTGDPIGHYMIVKNTKNKVSSPFREAEYKFMYHTGVDNRSALVDEAVAKEVITRIGSGHMYHVIVNGVEHKINGISNIPDYLTEHKEVADFVMEKLGVSDCYKNAFTDVKSLSPEQETIAPLTEETDA